MFERLKALFVAAGAVISLAPAASLVTSLVEMPPTFDGFLTFAASATGPIIFFLVYLARQALLGLGTRLVLALVSAATVGGLLSAYMTYEVADRHIRTYRYIDPAEGPGIHEDKYIVPEHYSDELSTIVNGRFRGRLDNAIKSDPPRMFDLMARDSRSVQRKIVSLFLLAHGLLLFGFLLAGWAALARVGGGQRKTKPRGRTGS